MNIFIGITRYALPFLAFIILVKCVMTLLLGHPVNKVYAYIIDYSTGEKIPLNMWETSIGKGKSCDVKLNYDTVAPSQAVISRRADGWYIFDTQSRSGTSVNGTKIEKRTLIKHGDKLKFSDKTFVFAVADDPVITVGGRKKKGRRQQQAMQNVPAPDSNAVVMRKKENPVVPDQNLKPSDFYDDTFNLNFKGKSTNGDALPVETVRGDTLHSGQKIYTGVTSADIYSDARTARTEKASTAEPALINLLNGEIYALCGNYIKIGRGSANDIKLTGNGVSRSHAALKKFKDGWAVFDTDSKAGTYLDGKKINQTNLLFEGDIIQICDNKLKYTNDYKKKNRR